METRSTGRKTRSSRFGILTEREKPYSTAKRRSQVEKSVNAQKINETETNQDGTEENVALISTPQSGTSMNGNDSYTAPVNDQHEIEMAGDDALEANTSSENDSSEAATSIPALQSSTSMNGNDSHTAMVNDQHEIEMAGDDALEANASGENENSTSTSGKSVVDIERNEEEIEQAIALRLQNTPYTLISGKKAGTKLLMTTADHHKFKSNTNRTGGEKAFTCIVTKCKARVVVYPTEGVEGVPDSGVCQYTKYYTGHAHSVPRTEKEQNRIEASESMKKRASKLSINDSFSQLDSVSNIFYSETKKHGVDDMSFNKTKRNLQRIRADQIPQSPKTTAEINEQFGKDFIMKHYGTTRRTDEAAQTPFFKIAADEAEHSYCIFASDEIAQITRDNVNVEKRKFFADATFASAPSGMYEQLLVVYTHINGQVLPFAWALMTKKTDVAYHAVFKYIHENVLSLECKVFMMDYEKAAQKGLKNAVPEMVVKHCWFHFKQANIRNAKKLGKDFLNFLHTNEDAKRIYKKLLCLPLLPADTIIEEFNDLKKEAHRFANEHFNRFIAYFERQWMKREGPESISVFDLNDRTTGAAEGYNSSLGKNIDKHGAFFKFVHGLLKDEEKKAYDVRVLIDSGGASANQKKKKDKMRAEQIEEATKMLKKGEIDEKAFLNRVTFHENCICDGFLDFDSIPDQAEDEQEEEVDIADVDSEVTEPPLDDKICKTCFEKPQDCCFAPCGHSYFCNDCFQLKYDQTRGCPVCRADIVYAIKIRHC